MSKEVNVLSVFDGTSTGLEALKHTDTRVGTYYSSEVDKYAIQISEKNHPEIVRMG
tara:strand:- start:14109 stop:14276 length:168 start_codon:yes stop_codon:yes gene_type:complete